MSSALTKRIVLTAEPRDRPYELRDAQVRGLILRVQPSGHKAWIVTWAHGKRRMLESVEHLSLDQARQAVSCSPWGASVGFDSRCRQQLKKKAPALAGAFVFGRASR